MEKPEPDPVIEAYKKHIDRTLLRENLKKSVAERLAQLVELQKPGKEARRAGKSSRSRRSPISRLSSAPS
jgi:hypothetical protein